MVESKSTIVELSGCWCNNYKYTKKYNINLFWDYGTDMHLSPDMFRK